MLVATGWLGLFSTLCHVYGGFYYCNHLVAWDFESFHSVLTLYVDRMAFDPAATLLLWLEDPIDVVMMVRVNINPI